MKTSPTARFSEGPVALTPKQANIYCWGWQKKARFRDAVCGRRFGKTFLGKAEIRRAARLAAEWGVSTEDEIWYCAPTFKQAKRVFWKRLKQAIPPSWRAGKPNETECSITTKAGHVIRIVGLDAYDNLRGSGLFFALVDEWADCVYAAWEEVLRQMLSTCRFVINGEERVGGHALRIGTPKGFNHCYDMRRYFCGAPSQGGGNNDALVAEIKSLREEVKGLRVDQKAQTGATIQATVESNDKAAQTVVAGVDKSAKASAWAKKVEYSE
ncbi:hypothetical protein [Janthinobacterium sp. MDB2-8]|uniref:hypothetical protein n=1 Tax=Janthinobacterium sp. MDB2-8 TaxID=1259338 RepID=UPI003F26D24F